MSSALINQFEPVTPHRALCAESPLWDPTDNSLCWTDIDGQTLHRLVPETGAYFSRDMLGRVGCIGLLAPHGYITAIEDEIVTLDRDFAKTQSVAQVGFDPSIARFNDGKVDPTGQFFWVGSIYLPRDKARAGIWRISADGRVDKVIDGITTANGIAWSPDAKTMYFADSWRRIIWAADYDAAGSVQNRRAFFQLDSAMGKPDGAAVDQDGFYWCAVFGGAQLLRLSPDGVLDCTVPVPTQCPTMVSFGGSKLDQMYLTSFGDTSKIAKLAADPNSGLVFAAQSNVQGLPTPRFRLDAT